MRTPPLIAGSLVFLLCASLAWPAALQRKETPAKSAKPVHVVDPYAIPLPSQGAYTGAYCPDPDTNQVTEKSIYDFEMMAGKKAFFVHLFVNWLEDNPVGESVFLAFPSQMCEMIRRRGCVPLITWQANLEAKDPDEGFLLDRIAKGEFDDHVRAWADAIKQYPGPVLLRWGQEMNGDWYPWSGVQNGGNKPLPGPTQTSPSGPARFRRAWIHMQDVFRIENVANVQWVWSVYHSNPVGQSWNEAENYWPGDERVNWIGISAVNWSRANRDGWKKWRNFVDLMDGCYKKVTTKFPTKPILLAEWACANQADSEDGDKSAWIKEALKTLPKRYQKVKAVCWYNDSVEAQPGYYPANFRLDFAPHRKTYAQGIAASYYMDHIPKQIFLRQAKGAR